MSHNYDRYRFISKAELARLANVSPRTFTRYLATKRQVLNAMGVSPKAEAGPQCHGGFAQGTEAAASGCPIHLRGLLHRSSSLPLGPGPRGRIFFSEKSATVCQSRSVAF